MSVSPIYLSEISPAKQRGFVVSVHQVVITFGIFFSNLTGIIFSNKHEWRIVFGFPMLMSIFQLVLLLHVPESPKWLLLNDKNQKAESAVKSFSGINDATENVVELQNEVKKENIMDKYLVEDITQEIKKEELRASSIDLTNMKKKSFSDTGSNAEEITKIMKGLGSRRTSVDLTNIKKRSFSDEESNSTEAESNSVEVELNSVEVELNSVELASNSEDSTNELNNVDKNVELKTIKSEETVDPAKNEQSAKKIDQNSINDGKPSLEIERNSESIDGQANSLDALIRPRSLIKRRTVNNRFLCCGICEKTRPRIFATNSTLRIFRFSLIKALLVCVIIHVAQEFSGINVILFYSTKIFNEAGIHGRMAELATAGTSFVFFIFTIISTILVDKFGRKFLLMASYITILIPLTILSTCIIFSYYQIGVEIVSVIAAFCVMFIVAGFSIGLGSIPWVILGEVFPHDAKGFYSAAITSLNMSTTFVVSCLFETVDNWMKPFTLVPFVILCIVSAVLSLLLVYETKGKTIEEITEDL